MEELPKVEAPYLPPKAVGDPEYTLVLDLDETLIHFVNACEDNADEQELVDDLEDGENDFFYMVRPHCNKFLTELSQHFEIVIFTAAMQDYADWIVDGIDHRGNVKHRLYRQHCSRDKPTTEGEQ